jgi:hypothetical protein
VRPVKFAVPLDEPTNNDFVIALSAQQIVAPLLRRVLGSVAAPAIRLEIDQRLARTSAGASLATLRMLDAPGFDKTLDARAVSNTPQDCPFTGDTARAPVSWLCFNNWYAYILTHSTATGWELSLSLNANSTKRCVLDGKTGVTACTVENHD